MNDATVKTLRRAGWVAGLVAFMVADTLDLLTPELVRAMGLSFLFVLLIDVAVDPNPDEG